MYFSQVEFGKRVRGLRKKTGMTQEVLAEELNISIDHMKKLECGDRACSLDMLLVLSSYFDVSTDYLLTGTDYGKERVRQQLLELAAGLRTIITECERPF